MSLPWNLSRSTSRISQRVQLLRFSSPALAHNPDDENNVDLSSMLQNLGVALTPPDTVKMLDQYIIGQPAAKRAVAIAMRNRWRRQQLPSDLRAEVVPKNILMVGPTGCGKTEIARRISSITNAPFIKVEATKFTEVGFHGKDVDQIIKDLVENALIMTKKRETERLKAEVGSLVEDRIITELIGVNSSSELTFRELYRAGALDDRNIVIEVKTGGNGGNSGPINIGGTMTQIPANMVKMIEQLQGGKGGGTFKEKKMPVKEARAIIEEQEMEKLMEHIDIKKVAIEAVEESGIVFIDEIDKICHAKGKYHSSDASSEGVQRDLLPLIEGSSITTKHGNVNTDHILFIASGAFHSCKPSDLLAELQGRLPIRVTLDALSEDDMYRILTEPVANLIRQQVELLATEGVKLVFEDEALREIAKIAVSANKSVENIGARRLHALIEKIVEEISFDASTRGSASSVSTEEGEGKDGEGGVFIINKEVVLQRLDGVLETNDLSRHIL